MHRKDGADAKHVGGFEWQTEDGVFGLTFDAGPHGAAFFGAVGTGAGDINKSHLRIDSGERVCDSYGQIEIDGTVAGFLLAGGGGSERKEAEVVAGHLILAGGDVVEVGNDERLKFRVVLCKRGTTDGEDNFNGGVGEALAKDALADHSGCAEKGDFHWRSSPPKTVSDFAIQLKTAALCFAVRD